MRLHNEGETVFQAMWRAAGVPGVDRFDPALLTAVPHGQLPLESGARVELPTLDAAGIAAICTSELEQSAYEAKRVLVTEPEPPPQPRVESMRLWPALRAAGYRVGPTLEPIGPRFTPRRVLAERTGINLRTVDRICSGSQKTITITVAITILDELPFDPLLDELEAQLARWETAMSLHHSDRLEYLEKLGLLAQQWLGDRCLALTTTELTTLQDVRLFLREAHREPSTDEQILTAKERLDAAHRWFRESLGRDPTPLSPRIRRSAEDSFRAEKRRALERQRALHKGLELPAITTAAVYARTYRLRRAGRLPAHGKPSPFRPPADFLDVR